MSDPRIRRAGPCDLPVLAELSRLSFAAEPAEGFAGSPWSLHSLAEVMALPGVFGLLSMAEEVPAGFALLRLAADEVELLSLGVAPPARRTGHGRGLLRAALAESARRGARRIILEVAEDNLKAQALYRQAGFAPEGRRRNYYRDSAGAASDAIILVRPLKPSLQARDAT